MAGVRKQPKLGPVRTWEDSRPRGNTRPTTGFGSRSPQRPRKPFWLRCRVVAIATGQSLGLDGTLTGSGGPRSMRSDELDAGYDVVVVLQEPRPSLRADEVRDRISLTLLFSVVAVATAGWFWLLTRIAGYFFELLTATP